MTETHPLVADVIADIELILAEDPPLTVPEVVGILRPLLKEFTQKVRGPSMPALPNSWEDRPPVENELMRHPVFKELCRRYGDAMIAMRDGYPEEG